MGFSSHIFLQRYQSTALATPQSKKNIYIALFTDQKKKKLKSLSILKMLFIIDYMGIFVKKKTIINKKKFKKNTIYSNITIQIRSKHIASLYGYA